MPRFPVVLATLLACASTALANREGSANAAEKAARLERRGEWSAAAAWWEGAAGILEAVSIPLSALGVREAVEDGDAGAAEWWTRYGEEDVRAAAKARERARTAAEKGGGTSAEEQARVDGEFPAWVAAYPENYWRWERWELRIQSRLAAGDEPGARLMEARARERWAARFEDVCARYWADRDAEAARSWRARAAEQRALARAAREAGEPARGTLERWRAAADPGAAARVVGAMEAARDLAGLRAVLAAVQGAEADDLRRRLGRLRDFAGLAADPGGARAAIVRHAEWYPILMRASASQDAGSTLAAEILAEWTSVPAAAAGDWLQSHTEAGLDVESFSDPELRSSAGRQTWEDVDQEWGLEAPGEGLPRDGWSVRATGFLRVEETLVAEIILKADDAIRLRVDGRLVLDEWAESADILLRRAPLRLDPGWHSVVLEYADRREVAALHGWLAPGRDQAIRLRPMLRRLPREAR